ncbi:rabankyrin-5 isoform X1 [Drosophila bipectinata]|uniref:rabankyrin-5 isoform X1 n=2 Tax=Drosophila bipectinata TaxID=42026 RepID=UPI001C8A3048|nr:rabankyrin-5 isoform X1 [Drosophila bipectinata]
MGGNGIAAELKLENHFPLKDEYIKLQKNYSKLERKYNELVSTQASDDYPGEPSSFSARLSLTAASLYGRHTYSDINIRTMSKIVPAHRFVLHARSEKWQDAALCSIQELDWSDIEEDIVLVLLRWIYTDQVDLHHDRLSLDLIKVAHRFSLSTLLGLCEKTLVSSVGIRSCVRFYCVAEEIGASTLLEHCSGIISTHWDDLTCEDFEHMSGPLLFKMLKNKSKNPLHSAVKLEREDVVLLCIVENNDTVSDFVNIYSENGLLPLQMALLAKNIKIAQTLVENGRADINALDKEGSPLVIWALRNCDVFSVNFLLNKNCLLDLMSRSSSDTALHIICNYNCRNENWKEIVKIGEQILERNPNVNIQNVKGESPLHIAVNSDNKEMVHQLLKVPNIDINLQTFEGKSALELSLTSELLDFTIASNLIHFGADPNVVKSSTGDSLLQVLTIGGEHFEEAAIFLADFSNLDHTNFLGLTALHIAASKNLSKLVRKLLIKGASCNLLSNNEWLRSPVHMAVDANSVDTLEAFVELKNSVNTMIDFNCQDCNGDSPLSFCLSQNKTHLVPILIRGGADINFRNSDNLSLLHQSISKRDEDTAVYLLEKGADYTSAKGEQTSSLIMAIELNLPRVVEALCIIGAALSSFDNNGVSPLWTALKLGYEVEAQILVKHGVDTDCWDIGPNGCMQTLLHRAIEERKEFVAIFLIESQCDLDSARQPGTNDEGAGNGHDKSSPLHLCCRWGLTKVLQTLIDHGANVNSQDSDKKTPLHIAIVNNYDEIITILLCHPVIDLKLRDISGNTCFTTALEVRNHKAAQRILDRLPSAAEQMDQRGRNFLHLAIAKDDLESVLFLISVQVDVNSRVHDANQSTPLHLAAASQNEMITRNLILAGARINERDALQKIPLHTAIELGNLSAVSALIQNNADFDAIDVDGNNALHLAVRNGQFLIVRELLTESTVNAEAMNFKGRNPMHELCRVVEDNTAATICELFLECMPKYPINTPDMDGNTPLLLSFMRGQSPLCKVLVKAGACLGTENKNGINIFNFKLATNQLLHKLLDQLPQESPWSESDVCQECTVKFTITMRKHHCRHCGRVLCFKCSNNDVPILKFGINKPVRVCYVCFTILQCGNGI